MAEATTIARPYAEAVFRLADEKNALAAWSSVLENLARVASHPEMKACIGNPQIARSHLVDWFLSLSKGVTDEGRNFVRLLANNNRLEVLPEIREHFENLRHEREGVLEAQIHSAFPLDEIQTARLIKDLESKFKRRVTATVTTDPELIGGVKIVVGDKIIDASVRAKLAAMRNVLRS